jgi:hypothetical protein
MKRSLIFLSLALILTRCKDPGAPLPRASNLSEIEVLGGPVFESGKELSLSAFLENLPRENNWDLVFSVNSSEISRQSLNNSSRSRVEFARFIPGAPGQYVFQACINSGPVNVCLNRSFVVK